MIGCCWYSATRLAYCDGSTRKVVVCPYHFSTHVTHSVVTEDTPFTGYEPKYTFNDSQKLAGQATPIPLEGNLSRSMMSSSLPALPSVPSDHFYDTMEITNPPAVQVKICVQEGAPCRRTVWTRRKSKHCLNRTSGEVSIRNKKI